MAQSQKTLPTGEDPEAFLAAVPDEARREDARSKGCLFLKRLDDVDREVLQELVERTVRVHRGADRASGS
jgi:hypothetical protein